EKVIAQGTAGVRKLNGSEPIAVDDLMHLGSITKPFTATVVASLVDEGKLGWDTTLAEAFPELAKKMRKEYRDVSVPQLLAHEAGIQPFEDDHSKEWLGLPKLEGDGRAQRRRFVEYALSLAPVEPPGTAFHYSNGGFVIAAAMAEAVADKSWEDLL